MSSTAEEVTAEMSDEELILATQEMEQKMTAGKIHILTSIMTLRGKSCIKK